MVRGRQWASLLDTLWGDVNLAAVNRSAFKEDGWSPDWWDFQAEWVSLGNDEEARKHLKRHQTSDVIKQTSVYISAVSANRQLAVALRNQGFDKIADHFAFTSLQLRQMVLKRPAFARTPHLGIRQRGRRIWAYLGRDS